MAYSTRYFGATGGPSGNDGSDWNNRAPLLVGGTSGTWSGSLTGWNFGLSGSLLAYIGPGRYTPSVPLAQTLFASPCGVSGSLWMCGCDASGNALQPDLGWNSCEPEYDTSEFPVLVANTNTNIFNLTSNFAMARCLYFEGNNVTTNVILRFCHSSYCKIHHKSSCVNAGSVMHESNSIGYDSIYQNDSPLYGSLIGCNPYNCRAIGNTGTSYTGGSGIGNNNAPLVLYKTTVIRAARHSVVSSSVSRNSMTPYYFDNTFFISGATMAYFSLTGINAPHGLIVNNYFADGPVGIDYMSFINCTTLNNRFRTFTTSIFAGTADNIFLFNQITGGTDAEFVNGTGSTSADLTISSSASSIWGNDYGVADQQPTGGGNSVGGFFFG